MNTESSFLSKSMSYIAEALRLGGKQMLCDIIKWTIIIIITAIVFLIVHHILQPPTSKGF
jgi:hypothetical protein